MSLIALAPAAVLLVGLVAVGAMVARLMDEADQFRSTLRRTAELRPLLAEVNDGSRRLRATLAQLRDR